MADESSQKDTDQGPKAEVAPKPWRRRVVWLIVLVAIAGGLALYFSWDRLLGTEDEGRDVAVLEPTTMNGEVVTAEEDTADATTPTTDEWQKYTNANFKFSLEYPGGWSVSDKLLTAKATSSIKEPLTIYKTSATSGARVVLYANPDGWGGQEMPEITYTGQWQGSSIAIVSQKTNTEADTTPDFPINPGMLSLQLEPAPDNFGLSILGYDFMTAADIANFTKIIESITRT